MVQISTEKIAKEMNDTLIHKQCILRSGTYLANYLSGHNRSVDALMLLGRCVEHDNSKIKNTEEFMSLASIVDEIGEMHDVSHVLSEKQKDAIKIHHSNNTHHPEYYDSPNDMTDLDLLEMACDCHARSKQMKTDLLEYIDAQQELRFHFDNEHFNKLRNYCNILVVMTKNDDYGDVLINRNIVHFDFKDSTLDMLEHFDDTCYPKIVKTERLILRRRYTPDFASISYRLYLLDQDEEVGQVSLKCNGFFEYKIYENYIGQHYASEAIKAISELSKIRVLKMNVRQDDEVRAQTALYAGFRKEEVGENTFVYKLRKK